MISMSEYIDPRLLVLVPVLYLLGAFIKKSRVSDWLIPFILGLAGIFLSVAYLFAVTPVRGVGDVAGIVFTGATQGILCAGAGVYTDNVIRQAKKRFEDGNESDND